MSRKIYNKNLLIFLADSRKKWTKEKYLLSMFIPVILYYVVFHYIPIYGVLIAFKDFSPTKGIMRSEWVGFIHFMDFFNSYYFWRLIRNTVLINAYSIIFSFPAPIILALMLNEVGNKSFKKIVQTTSYLPHFISLVVVVGIIVDFTERTGLINDIITVFGLERIPFLTEERWFRTIFIGSEIWQGVGWGSIVYLAVLSSIDQQLYEAAVVDGAGRWKQLIHITLPGIAPTIIILLILRIGRMMDVGAQKTLLLYNPLTYETADVISTFVYRKGILDYSFSYSTAVNLFNTVINLSLVIFANKLSRKITDTSLW